MERNLQLSARLWERRLLDYLRGASAYIERLVTDADAARLGEKYTLGLQGSNYDKILPFLSLYWLTDCYGSSIWFYKTVSDFEYILRTAASFSSMHLQSLILQVFGPKSDPNKNEFSSYISKPSGYSQYPREISRPPRHWVEKLMNLVWYAEPKVSSILCLIRIAVTLRISVLDCKPIMFQQPTPSRRTYRSALTRLR